MLFRSLSRFGKAYIAWKLAPILVMFFYGCMFVALFTFLYLATELSRMIH